MTFTQFATLVRFYTKTNSTTFTDADILALANIYKGDMASLISSAVGEDYFGLTFERDLAAGTRQYDLPTEMMSKIKYVEADLDGDGVYTRLNETDIIDYHEGMDEATILNTYADRDPEYDLWGSNLYIFSGEAIIAVTNGLRVRCIIYPADFTSLSSTEDMSNNPTTTSFGFPKQFHELLARRVSIAWKSSKDRPVPLSEKEQMFEVDLARQVSAMKDHNLDRTTIPTAPYLDGSDY